MPGEKGKKIIIVLIFMGIAGFSVLLFFIFGPPKLLAKTDTPEFCVKCHVIDPYYEAWFHAGAHRRKLCVDCHLPNDTTTNHYLWKALFGVKEVVVNYTGKIPEPLKITSKGGKVLQSNCIRCHEITVMIIDTDRRCWDCHRRISHMHVGIRETI